MSAAESPHDQLSETQQLISDTSEMLKQAIWALQTLVVQLGDTTSRATARADADTVSARPDAGAVGANAGHIRAASPIDATGTALAADEPPERRRRHRWWVREGRRPATPRSER